jgi:hypothetical protein
MAHTVVATMVLTDRLRNSHDKTVNIAPLGRISVCWNSALSLA